MSKLMEFYGTECPHCIEMRPIVERVEKELGVEIEKIEVWHNAENAKLFQKIDGGFCGGVPFFYNEDTEEKLCGAQEYEDLLAWAKKSAKKKK